MELFLLVALPIAVWVAVSDLASMRIPNKAVVILLVGFLALWPVLLTWPDLMTRLIQFAAVLLAGFILSTFRVLGAGDAKFAAVGALYIDLSRGNEMLAIVAVCFLGSVGLHRSAARVSAIRGFFPEWESWDRSDFPMGVPLGLALCVHLIAPVIVQA